VGILQELLKEIKGDDNTEKIRKLCDKIAKEEEKNIKNFLMLPKGPNIFLSLEVPGRTTNMGRESFKKTKGLGDR